MTTANTSDVKTYTNKSNAKRAIKAHSSNGYALGVWNQFITPVQGGFLVDLNEVSQYELDARANFAAQEAERAKQNAKAPTARTQKPKVLDVKPTKVFGKNKEVTHESTIVRPCKQVWHIADSMPTATRKEVIQACEDAGIAFYTARTQYQQWSACQKEMAARAVAKK